MPESKRRVQTPQGVVEGIDVPIKEATEKWSEVTLADGTILRIKPNVLTVTRVDNQYDPEGNPMYVLMSSQMMTVTNVPAHLRKGAAGTKAN